MDRSIGWQVLARATARSQFTLQHGKDFSRRGKKHAAAATTS
jgi:hypothetical protein